MTLLLPILLGLLAFLIGGLYLLGGFRQRQPGEPPLRGSSPGWHTEAMVAVKGEVDTFLKESGQKVLHGGPLIDLTCEMLKKMPILDSAVDETLRLTATPTLIRANQDMTLNMADGYGSKTTDFYKAGKKVKYYNMPWGAGVSMCPGRFFANNELKPFIFLMLVYYEIELKNTHDEVPDTDLNRKGFGNKSSPRRHAVSTEARKRKIEALTAGYAHSSRIPVRGLTAQQKVTTASLKALRVLAKHNRPFTDAEVFKEVMVTVLEELATDKSMDGVIASVKQVSLSARSAIRRIEALSDAVQGVIIKGLSQANYFSLAIDKSTDSTDVAQLCVYVRYF
ncbi:hypothetical protein JOQ06_013803 [Pogonophryne albipinna]|uniref:Cytochrome P450 n=1 Tax=Pogonophryne albipinna TaxID=1090488 RepID=A0AAD6BM47_9TELE|nr:hypothetical protein JOQ06_013803 [Pogonophryne albipinna]